MNWMKFSGFLKRILKLAVQFIGGWVTVLNFCLFWLAWDILCIPGCVLSYCGAYFIRRSQHNLIVMGKSLARNYQGINACWKEVFSHVISPQLLCIIGHWAAECCWSLYTNFICNFISINCNTAVLVPVPYCQHLRLLSIWMIYSQPYPYNYCGLYGQCAALFMRLSSLIISNSKYIHCKTQKVGKNNSNSTKNGCKFSPFSVMFPLHCGGIDELITLVCYVIFNLKYKQLQW